MDRHRCDPTRVDSRPAVYLLTPPSAWPNTFTIDTAVVRDEVAPIVRRVAAEIGIPLIDVHDATAQSSGLFRDGIHPDADGNAIVAETVRARLQETAEKSE